MVKIRKKKKAIFMKKILVVLQLTIFIVLLSGCKEQTVDKIETFDQVNNF